MWRPTENLFGGTAYLGHAPTAVEERPCGSGEAREPRGPGTCVDRVGTLDLFYEEDVTNANALRAVGVPCELDVVDGA